MEQIEIWKVRKFEGYFLLLLFNFICVQRHDLLVISRRCHNMTESSIFTFTVRLTKISRVRHMT